MSSNKDANQMTFGEHLDELGSTVLKATALTIVFSIVAFLLKEELFQIVFAPKYADFITYRMLGMCGGLFGQRDSIAFQIELINTGLAGHSS